MQHIQKRLISILTSVAAAIFLVPISAFADGDLGAKSKGGGSPSYWDGDDLVVQNHATYGAALANGTGSMAGDYIAEFHLSTDDYGAHRLYSFMVKIRNAPHYNPSIYLSPNYYPGRSVSRTHLGNGVFRITTNFYFTQYSEAFINLNFGANVNTDIAVEGVWNLSAQQPFSESLYGVVEGGSGGPNFKAGEDSRLGFDSVSNEDSTDLSNYPEPFNPSTMINFDLPEDSFVNLSVFDASGRQIRSLASSDYQAGSHAVRFDATGLPSGAYFYRLQTSDGVRTKMMRLVK